MHSKILNRIIGILIGAMIWGVLLPYVKVENLTKEYGDEFKDLYKQSSYIDEIEYYKVFYYDYFIAHVYYVESGHSTRNYLIFHNIKNKWQLISEECIWSSSGGGASGSIWPFYP